MDQWQTNQLHTLTSISNSFSGNQKAIRHIHPRVSFIRSDRSTPSLSLSSRHRSVRVYEAEFTDVTQLYSIKSSDDTAVSSSIERKYFPDHEVNHDCIPMSDWQTLSFREYQRWGLYCLLISRTHNDISLFAITATCNSFHETAILDFTLVRSGSWRDTWINDGDADNIIVKTIRWGYSIRSLPVIVAPLRSTLHTLVPLTQDIYTPFKTDTLNSVELMHWLWKDYRRTLTSWISMAFVEYQ